MRLIAFFLLAFAVVMRADATPEIKADHVTLAAFVEAPLNPGGTTWIAIRQRIEPGWHTYWRNPGDSGLATSVVWTLPPGITAGEPLWPTPQRFTDGAIVNYGYGGDAVLLVPVKATANAAVGPLHTKVTLLECQHMCIPEDIALTIDPRTASAPPGLFEAARAALPQPFRGAVQTAVDGRFVALSLQSSAILGADGTKTVVFPATENVVDDEAPPEIRITGDTLTWRMPRAQHGVRPAAFSAVVAIPGKGAFAVQSPVVVAAPAQAPVHGGGLSLLGAIALAFAGGLVLNLMPCVFPILSIKALAFAQSGGDLRAARRDGVFYAAGVLATFSLIAGVLLLLRGGGEMLGWGFQLQSPYVVLTLVLLTAAVGFNLLGLFEIPMLLAGAGDSLTRSGGSRGAFFTGALAVLVASPCTAPFMGAALGFALTQLPASAFLVFLSLGAGFALPFSLIAMTPALVRRIPRPGPWMVRFKQVLGFPMLATSVWLLWVLDRQTGPDGMAITLVITLLFAFLIWLTAMLKSPLRLLALIGGAAAAVLLASGLRPTPAQAMSAGTWTEWSPQAVKQALGSGHPVFVDFSAAWCVTCLVNERYALQDQHVAEQFQKQGIVTLRADWTDRNAAIATELARHQRSGVPLYLLYTREGREIVLPQILTPSAVLARLRELQS